MATCGDVRLFPDQAARSCGLKNGHAGEHESHGAFGEVRRWGAK